MRHRIFFALGLTIVVAVWVAGFVVHSASKNASDVAAFRDFASDRFISVWDNPVQRADLAESIQRHFHVSIILRDSQRSVLFQGTALCESRTVGLDLVKHGRVVGYVEGCASHHRWPKVVIFGLVSIVLVLWAMSGFIARSLVRPLDELVQVVRRIGEGQLDARTQLCRERHAGEVGELARAVNQMAERIERQIAGQRELLAAVSHEIRSPLARLRVLVELEREAGANTTRLDSMDVELTEMDSLVGQLLAQSRLEFQTLDRRAVPAVELAKTALERAAIPAEFLEDDSQSAKVSVDMGLLGRALLNVLANAQRHGQGLVSFRVRVEAEFVLLEIRDRGPGFDAAMLSRAFEPFVGTAQQGGLGLGLSLVERIVCAHAGKVTLLNSAGGGAVVTIALPRVSES